MKIKLLSILTIFFTCSLVAQDSKVIYLDDIHNSSEKEISNTSRDYITSPSKFVTINTSKLKFKKTLFKRHKPNFLQLIFDDKNMFSMKINPESSEFTLQRETLEITSGKFKGFQNGDRVLLVLGKLNYNKKSKQYSLTQQWLGAIRVTTGEYDKEGSNHDICSYYIYKIGASMDFENLHHHCVSAAQTGNPSSITLLAETYYFGYGVEQNYELAGKLYEKAAIKGHVHAQLMMYFTYVVRLKNVSSEEQKSKSLKYLKKAANSGYGKAVDKLNEIRIKH